MAHIYDVIIIGGGPAGFTAALYAARAGLDTLVFEKLVPGGQMCQTSQIDNYPGFDRGIDGVSLGAQMKAGAERFGAEIISREVSGVKLSEDIKSIETSGGAYRCRSVIIATGAEHRSLGLENEKRLIGSGVSYCAACDGMFYKDKTVAVVGGGNSAATDALILSRVCKKVYLIHRRDTLRAAKVYHQPLMSAENIEPVFNSTVIEITGGERVYGVNVRNVLTGEMKIIPCQGVFVSIGRDPVTCLFKDETELDEGGYIKADETCRTNLPGVFAAGDVRTKPLRQIVTAASDGAVAAQYAEEYLAGLK